VRVALCDAALSQLNALEGYDAVSSLDVSPLRAVAVLVDHFAVPVPAHLRPEIGLVWAHAFVLHAHNKPISIAMPDDDREPSECLAVLRGFDLQASAAVLHFRERSPPVTLPDIGRLLVGAGYGEDDVFSGFVKNGLGTMTSLRLLAGCGWNVDDMVRVQLRAGSLLPEVRDALLTLGLTRAAVVDVLLRHAPSELVELTLP
jgi:hypothetical protein